MGCNCHKRKIATQPKKIIKHQARKPSEGITTDKSTNVVRRIIRRATR